MQVHTAQPHGLLQILIPLAIFAVVIALRARRLTQLRPLNIERLWIVPVVYLAVVVLLFLRTTPTPLAWGLCAIALVAGAALGWQRGKTMHIHVDPATGTLNQKGSLASILFIVALYAIKLVGQQESSTLHLNIILISQVLGVLGLGMFTFMRVEMYLRSKRLLDEARGQAAA